MTSPAGWVRDIGLSLSRTPELFTDNISALHLTANSVFHARTKHIELDYHFITEKVVQGTTAAKFVPSLQQVADILEKTIVQISVCTNFILRGMLDYTKSRRTVALSRVCVCLI